MHTSSPSFSSSGPYGAYSPTVHHHPALTPPTVATPEIAATAAAAGIDMRSTAPAAFASSTSPSPATLPSVADVTYSYPTNSNTATSTSTCTVTMPSTANASAHAFANLGVVLPPTPLPPKRRPGRPPVYVFTKPDSELSENERRLKGAVLKRRYRQNRSYHRKKHLRHTPAPSHNQKPSPEHTSSRSPVHSPPKRPNYSYDNHFDADSQYPSSNVSNINNDIPPLALPALQHPLSATPYCSPIPRQEPQQYQQQQQQQQQDQYEQSTNQGQYSYNDRSKTLGYSLSPPTITAFDTFGQNHHRNQYPYYTHSNSNNENNNDKDNNYNNYTKQHEGDAVASRTTTTSQDDSHYYDRRVHHPLSPSSYATTVNSNNSSHSHCNSSPTTPRVSTAMGEGGLRPMQRSSDETSVLQQLLDLSTAQADSNRFECYSGQQQQQQQHVNTNVNTNRHYSSAQTCAGFNDGMGCAVDFDGATESRIMGQQRQSMQAAVGYDSR